MIAIAHQSFVSWNPIRDSFQDISATVSYSQSRGTGKSDNQLTDSTHGVHERRSPENVKILIPRTGHGCLGRSIFNSYTDGHDEDCIL